MKLTKEDLALFCLNFLKETESLTFEVISEKLNEGVPSTISRWYSKQQVRGKYFDGFVNACENHTRTNVGKQAEFAKKLVNSLDNSGYNLERINNILRGDQPLSQKLYTLVSNANLGQNTEWKDSDIMGILSELRSLLHNFEDYISISDQKLDSMQSSIAGNLFHDNYIILNFVNDYKVAVSFFDGNLEDITVAEADRLKKMKKHNGIDLTILFMSKETAESTRDSYLMAGNIFIERLTKADLRKGTFSDLRYDDVIEIYDGIKTKLYARVAFDKLSDYFVIIKNDMLFKQYINDGEKGKPNDFRSFIDRRFIKDIMNYSYLSRHALYFERDNLKEVVESKTKKGIWVLLLNSFSLIPF